MGQMDPEREQVHVRKSHRKLQSQSTLDLYSLSSLHVQKRRAAGEREVDAVNGV